MALLNDLQDLIEKAAGYLLACEVCPEDRVRHNGRRAYGWTLFRYIYERTRDQKALAAAETLAEQLAPHVKQNREGAWIIFPGLEQRRNYSTNAIDCGIFVDAYFDFKKICASQPRDLEDKVDRVVHTYLVSKIRTAKAIHNQYLWAATGVARWVAHNGDHPKCALYRELLRDTLNKWLRFNRPDGAAPYQSDDASPDLGGLTPYYHSRCLAFCWYVLEKAGIQDPEMEAKLYRGAAFLSRMVQRTGCKQPLLECKRYYFSGPGEVGSHPYDAYAYFKAWAGQEDENWSKLAFRALGALIAGQKEDGSITHGNPCLLRDWQCPTMRTSHLAWLTRIGPVFIHHADSSGRGAAPFTGRGPGKSETPVLMQIGGTRGWVHFLTEKTPMTGFSGHRTIGPIFPHHFNIHRMIEPYWLHYRIGNHPLSFLKEGKREVKKTFRHVLWHFIDYLVYKKNLLQAFFILKVQWFDFIFVGLFRRSTEFCLKLPNLRIAEDKIEYDLSAADVFGRHPVHLGKRTMQWDQHHLLIEDRLTYGKSLKVRLPARCALDGKVMEKGASTRVREGTVTYRISFHN